MIINTPFRFRKRVTHPHRVVGLRDVPVAGDTLLVVPSDEMAVALVKKRVAAWELRQHRMMERDKRGGKGREGKSLAVVVKTDVFGTRMPRVSTEYL